MISFDQFLLRQPSAPEVTSTDKYYFDLCNSLVEIAKAKNLFPSYPEKVVERAALTLIGYYQDVISDAGIWRSFIEGNRKLYGYTLPFYEIGDNYIDYELNKADVRFMVWYALSMNYEDLRAVYPLDDEIINGADEWWEELERVYDDSPTPVDYNMVKEVEINAPEDKETVMRFANWLFMHCYLMTPAFALTLSEMALQFDLQKEEGVIEFRKKLDESMSKVPTGPLALFLGEWLYLIIDGKIYPEQTPNTTQEHKYYKAFVEATDGKKIEFFDSYEKLNEFFISVLGWAENEEHLPQVKGAQDYILMVDPKKGILLARNVAKNIACPFNPLYDKEYAKVHAIDMLTVRGNCPADLTKYVCKEKWLPDASFKGTNDHEIVKKNHDFIMRCYLQDYYRD